MRERLGSLAELILFNEITIPSHCIQLAYMECSAEREIRFRSMWRTRGALHTERERAHFQPLFPNLHWGCNQLFYICLSISKFNPLKNIPNCTAARESNLYVRSHEKIPFSRGIKNLNFCGGIVYAGKKRVPVIADWNRKGESCQKTWPRTRWNSHQSKIFCHQQKRYFRRSASLSVSLSLVALLNVFFLGDLSP